MRPGRRSSGKLHLPVSVVKHLGQGSWQRTAISPGTPETGRIPSTQNNLGSERLLIRFLWGGFFDYDGAALHDPADIVDHHVDIGQRIAFHGGDVGEIAGCNGAELLP